MMRKLIVLLLAVGVVAAGAAWFLSAPRPLAASAMDGLTGDADRGEQVFWATGCASCHAAPDAEGEARLVLAGGYRIVSPFGTFVTPNISPSDEGIGGWTAQDLADALIAGVSPEGRHYYPSLPYTTYVRMELQDVADLKAFLDTLPASDTPSAAHELSFPFNIRRTLGLWKLLYLDKDWITSAEGEEQERGRKLVEAEAHCGECHTPRTALGGLDTARWLQGAPNPSGEGKIPGIAPGLLDWSATDIAYYLETGFTPDYDSAGGEMASVVRNMAHLAPEDRQAIAAYVKALPPVETNSGE